MSKMKIIFHLFFSCSVFYCAAKYFFDVKIILYISIVYFFSVNIWLALIGYVNVHRK